MKIKYQMPNNFFKMFNEFSGITSTKNQIIKNPNNKIHGYIYMTVVSSMLLFIIMLIFAFIFYNNDIITSYIINVGSFVLTFYLIFNLSIFFSNYTLIKKTLASGVLILDENGITDKNDNGVTINFAWESIKLIVFTKNVITVLGDSTIGIFIQTEHREKIKKIIEKYKKDTVIVERD